MYQHRLFVLIHRGKILGLWSVATTFHLMTGATSSRPTSRMATSSVSGGRITAVLVDASAVDSFLAEKTEKDCSPRVDLPSESV